MTDSELQTLTSQINNLLKDKTTINTQINDLKSKLQDIDHQLNSLATKQMSMLKQFTYDKIPDPIITNTTRHASKLDLEEKLGPVVAHVSNNTNTLRRKVLERAIALPFVEKPNTIRFLIESGYGPDSATQIS